MFGSIKKFLGNRQVVELLPGQDVSRSGRKINASAGRFLPAAPIAPDLDVYLPRIQRFLSSEAGGAFLERMRAIEAGHSASAVQDVMHTAHSAGRAAGFADARKWILSLSRISVRDIAETGEGRHGSASLTTSAESEEFLQPGATGDAPLAERLSP